ncbi:hypothetical protein [Paenibacillus qinlingensis]|uniref:hypothetical protein n=1 Tax=Paenibacillus qinlingensis TaxID=1837343 RepID=UPI0015639F65|nr:hypothetical protein [Paenibacillus qinlingensis]NQX62894.1 hypothetical protein [Paenibacillus qinlingensis]
MSESLKKTLVIMSWLLVGCLNYFIFILTKLELTSYISLMLYVGYLFIRKRLNKRDKIILLVLIFPSLVKMCAFFLYGYYQLLKNHNKMLILLTRKWNPGVYEYGLIRYLSVFFLFFIFLFLALALMNPVINLYYHGDLKAILDNGLTIYFLGTLTFFIIWLLISICIYLVKSAISISTSAENDIFKIVGSYIFIIILFLVVPDFLYAIIYSSTMTMLLDQHQIIDMFYFSFMLHHQIPMNEYYSNIGDMLQQKYVYGLISGVHVLTVKVLDGTIVAAVIVTLFSDKLMRILRSRESEQ